MKPEISGHRGASNRAPENTIAAINAAIEDGASWIEIDIQMTKDNRIVLMHDDTVDRTTNGSGRICDLTLEQIRTLDAGSWFDASFQGEKIPLLQEVMDVVRDRVKLNIEIKHGAFTNNQLNDLLSLIRQNEFEQLCILTSFQKSYIEYIHQLNPHLKVGWIIEFFAEPVEKISSGFYQLVSLHHKLVRPEYVELFHNKGKLVHVWTVNEISEAQQMLHCGVDNIITNYPARLRKYLNQNSRIE